MTTARFDCIFSRRLIRVAAPVVLLAAISDTATAQLRIATYNTAQGPRVGIDTVLESIGEELTGGIATPIDVLILQEQSQPSTTTQQIVNVLNGIYGAGTYARGSLSGDPFWSDIRQSVIYNTQSVTLLGETGIGNAGNSPLQPREAFRYHLRPVGYDSTADFYIYNSHYKSGTGGTELQQRLVEAQAIRNDSDNVLGQGSHVIYAGDFNMQSSGESAYQELLSSGAGQAFDPINVSGTWHNRSSKARWHTQSPSDSSVPGLVGGGIDDRFDFQLVSSELQDNEGLAYIGGSYHTFGNNGSTYNDPINQGNSIVFSGITSYTKTQILDALASVTDHLPVVADYQVPAMMDVQVPSIPATVNLGSAAAVNVLVENIANVVAANGADELDYTLSVSGDLFGGISSIDLALGGGNTHQVTLDTSSLGAKSGLITVTSTSQGVANGLFTIPINYTVGDAGALVTVARDNFDTNLNLAQFTQNPAPGAFTDPGDGFDVFQVGVSASIPSALIDESFSAQPTDTLGIVDASSDSPGFKSDRWFGVIDTTNPDNPTGDATATWVFDISDATGLQASIDMAAMGDFEANDVYNWTYQIDDGNIVPLFSSTVAEDMDDVVYRLANGAERLFNDPLLMATNGGQTIRLSNVFQTLTSAILGAGDLLTIDLSVLTNGGSEAFVFDNILIAGFVESVGGDFDSDGDVDGDDFLAWQSGFGIESGATLEEGDADADGDVDGDDFLIWQSNFGTSTGNGSAAVPEPAALGLALILAQLAILLPIRQNRN